MEQDKLSLRQKSEIAMESVVAAGLELIPVVGSLITTSYFGYKQEKAITVTLIDKIKSKSSSGTILSLTASSSSLSS